MSVDLLDIVGGMRAKRRAFLQAIVPNPEDQQTLGRNELSSDDIKKLRSAAVFFIAEFLFVIQKLDLTKDSEGLEAYLKDHNESVGRKIAALREGKRSATHSGLTKSRLQESLIDDWKIEEMVAAAKDGFFRFDQSTIGALLNEIMVKQSTNSHLDVLGKAGLLKISGRRPKYIISNGIIEQYYEDFLKGLKDVFT
ncbi:MAG: hypothetical protein ABJN34_09020 [Litoreibacter sp.]|uniref:hypothetical protein n=1 Tax=Litoreibacter sp. TaxID=1969459 RepID=UPI003297149A